MCKGQNPKLVQVLIVIRFNGSAEIVFFNPIPNKECLVSTSVAESHFCYVVLTIVCEDIVIIIMGRFKNLD